MRLLSVSRILGAGAVLCAFVLAPSGAVFAQGDNQRCEGSVVDDQGAPLAGVTITFHQVDKNIYAQPVKTSQ
jgi:hypothetical protein